MDNKRILWVAWQPHWHAAWPLVIFAGGAAGAFGLARLAGLLASDVILWLADSSYLLIAAYYILRVRRQPLTSLGATERNWPQAMGVGAVLGLLLGSIALARDLLAGGRLTIPPLDLNMVALVIPLLLVIAAEEIFFRGWFWASLEPAVGVLPALLIASLAYSLWPLAFAGETLAGHSFLYTPIGPLTMLGRDLPIVFIVALFLNAIYRMTGSLWASGLANFLGRFALAFTLRPAESGLSSPPLFLAVSLALWAVVILYTRRWARSAI